ncbi:hypothetical protein ThesuDRAFT_01344 [Thermaerobacter subterraneus DSM 13965]|uniref:Uncharacterized protein n=1 Tax=Thermaerobacter subterraneus DSM 13965 TaxID=867903 RepID=K6P3H0_9FIRM|nr:hypothetical protein ThesuDRAFT_01344 [Thermaerobacter subterraneus DSM 13965]
MVRGKWVSGLLIGGLLLALGVPVLDGDDTPSEAAGIFGPRSLG